MRAVRSTCRREGGREEGGKGRGRGEAGRRDKALLVNTDTRDDKFGAICIERCRRKVARREAGGRTPHIKLRRGSALGI